MEILRFNINRRAISRAVRGIAFPISALGLASGVFGEDWQRITFPSEKHANNDAFPEYAGEMRGQAPNFFGVSPANPLFMIQACNMKGQTLVSNNGMDFRPSGNKSGRIGTTFGFSRHDGDLAFGLMGPTRRPKDEADEEHPHGIYRTTDAGATWEQVLQLPEARALEKFDRADNGYGTGAGDWGEKVSNQTLAKRLLLVDPASERSDHIYYADTHRGLLRSTDNGDTWDYLFADYSDAETADRFKDKYVKTLAAGVSSDGETKLYAIIEPDPDTHAQTGWTMEDTEGELWRIELVGADGVVESVEGSLCNERTDIADVEVFSDGASGFVLIQAQTSSGGSELYPFSNEGRTFTHNDDDSNVSPLLDNFDEEVDSLVGVYVNPHNDSHVVVPRGVKAALSKSFVWSNDAGETWNDTERSTFVSSDGIELVIDFVSGSPEEHHTASGGWRMMEEAGVLNGGPIVGFVDSSTVVWWSNSKNRPLLISYDYGDTASHFATGTDTKGPGQINSGYGGDVLAVAFGEYGFSFTIDGGLSWRGYTLYNTRALQQIGRAAQNSGSNSGGAANRGVAIAFNEDTASGLFEAYGLHSSMGYLAKFEQTTSGENDWDISKVNDSGGNNFGTTHMLYENGMKGGAIGDGFHVGDHIYMGNLFSSDGGSTWSNAFLDPGVTDDDPMVVLAVSSRNGRIAVATTHRVGAGNADWALYVTIDGGSNWERLPDPPTHEALAEDGSGSGNYYFPIAFAGYNEMEVMLDIDPRAQHDPTVDSANRLRILLPGRMGVYEFNATSMDGSAGTWSIHNSGIDPDVGQFDIYESVYWIHGIQFDPTESGIVYASKGRVGTDGWLPHKNGNARYSFGTAEQPLYISYDWGETWTNLHDSDSDVLPDFITVSTMHVTKPNQGSGTLYVGSMNHGLYRYEPEWAYDPFESGILSGGIGWYDEWTLDGAGSGVNPKVEIITYQGNSVCQLYDRTNRSTTNILGRVLRSRSDDTVLSFEYDLDRGSGNSGFEVEILEVDFNPLPEIRRRTVWDSSSVGTDVDGEPDALQRVNVDLRGYEPWKVVFKNPTQGNHASDSQYLFLDNVKVFRLEEEFDGIALVERLPVATAAAYAGDIRDYLSSTALNLTFTKVSGPAWLTIGSDGSLSGTPTIADHGIHDVVVRLTSEFGNVREIVFSVEVDGAGPVDFASNSIVKTTWADTPLVDSLFGDIAVEASVASVEFSKLSGPDTGTDWLTVGLDGGLSGSPESAGSQFWEILVTAKDGAGDVLGWSIADLVIEVIQPAFDDFESGDFSGGDRWIGDWEVNGGVDTHGEIVVYEGNSVVKIYDTYNDTDVAARNWFSRELVSLDNLWLTFDYDLDGLAGNSELKVRISGTDDGGIDIGPLVVWSSSNYGSDNADMPDGLTRAAVDLSSYVVEKIQFLHTTQSVDGDSELLFIDNVEFASLDSIVSRLVFEEEVAPATNSLSYSGSLEDYVTNPGVPLTYSKISGPSWLTVASDGTLSGVPDMAGEYAFAVEVCSGSACVTADFTGYVLGYAYDPIAYADAPTGLGYDTGEGWSGAWERAHGLGGNASLPRHTNRLISLDPLVSDSSDRCFVMYAARGDSFTRTLASPMTDGTLSFECFIRVDSDYFLQVEVYDGAQWRVAEQVSYDSCPDTWESLSVSLQGLGAISRIRFATPYVQSGGSYDFQAIMYVDNISLRE